MLFLIFSWSILYESITRDIQSDLKITLNSQLASDLKLVLSNNNKYLDSLETFETFKSTFPDMLARRLFEKQFLNVKDEAEIKFQKAGKLKKIVRFTYLSKLERQSLQYYRNEGRFKKIRQKAFYPTRFDSPESYYRRMYESEDLRIWFLIKFRHTTLVTNYMHSLIKLNIPKPLAIYYYLKGAVIENCEVIYYDFIVRRKPPGGKFIPYWSRFKDPPGGYIKQPYVSDVNILTLINMLDEE